MPAQRRRERGRVEKNMSLSCEGQSLSFAFAEISSASPRTLFGNRENREPWQLAIPPPLQETQRAEGACLRKMPPLWASFAKVARSAAGWRAAEGGGRTGMHVIVGLTSQTDGQALCSAGVWQVGSPARLACCFSSPAFLFFFFLLLLSLPLSPPKNSYETVSAKSPNSSFSLPARS